MNAGGAYLSIAGLGADRDSQWRKSEAAGFLILKMARFYGRHRHLAPLILILAYF